LVGGVAPGSQCPLTQRLIPLHSQSVAHTPGPPPFQFSFHL